MSSGLVQINQSTQGRTTRASACWIPKGAPGREESRADGGTQVIDFTSDRDVVLLGDNLDVLPKLPDESFQLIYVDPPFNTGGRQERRSMRTTGTQEGGDRTGFG